MIEEDTENTGVMMYYGDARKKNCPRVDFRSNLLRHLIVALQVLQKEGNMLLKVIYRCLLTFSLIALWTAFQRVF